ncbi:xylose isomerase-like protein [Clohesyomyces aquaticus]|uniref:Apurinic-apyrimidinic endonuclease 1 n=1 Tax=Clohesyomyces aquaticus TaxID=1231657 RepID=A0A1Y1YSX0_9PLEO|nr:xylose isomerase-like protein [Clohesyomyces aquaticus]
MKTEVTTKTALDGRGQKRKAETTVRASNRTKKAAISYGEGDAEESASDLEETPKPKAKGRATKKVKVAETKVEAEVDEDGDTKVKTVKRKTKSKASKKETDLAPLQQRTVDTKLRVGAHVSIAGGVQHSISNVLQIGANAFALFLKSQRKWDNPPLEPENAALFIDGCKKHGIEVGDCCLPHGSYLVNLAHPEAARKKQAYDSFLDDLTRCHTLGIRLYNFHPGNSNATTREEGIRLIAEHINTAHKDPATGSVIPVLETMASLGNTIGGTFKDIAEIINHVDDKDRVGVCIDTCHVFAAGYDLRTPEAYAETMTKFDEVIGLKYLKALHMNDSKAPFNSNRDLHAQIGTGYLGLRAFHNIVNDERLHGLPMVLETPIDATDANGKKFEDKGVWAREIKILEQLVGMGVESDEFKKLESDLQEAGKQERARIGEQVERKKAKAKPTKGKGKAKSKKKVETEDEEDSED